MAEPLIHLPKNRPLWALGKIPVFGRTARGRPLKKRVLVNGLIYPPNFGVFYAPLSFAYSLTHLPTGWGIHACATLTEALDVAEAAAGLPWHLIPNPPAPFAGAEELHAGFRRVLALVQASPAGRA